MNYTVTVPSADVVAGTTGNTTVGSGTLNFNGEGQLASITNTVPISIPTLADDATSPLALSGPFGRSPIRPSPRPQWQAPPAPPPRMDSPRHALTFAVQPDGTIEGTFTSGDTLALGQVAVASVYQ